MSIRMEQSLRAHAVAYASVAAFCFASSSSLAADRLVPQQYPSIQAAINAAIAGDTVIVADGAYTGAGNRMISYGGKAITVRSANGPDNCIIDVQAVAGDSLCGVIFNSADSAAAVLEGFTIRGGNQFNGAGITISNSSPTVRNCVLTDNTCVCWGAAIYVEGLSTSLIENCTIVGNTSAAEGGGVFVWNASPTFKDCSIIGNFADLGAGVCTFSGSPKFVNCIIADNASNNWVGGAYMTSGSLTNCTIVGNSATTHFAGVYLSNTATAANCIIRDNTGPSHVQATAGAITYSNIQGGFAGLGNIDADAKFVTSVQGDYRLAAGSPCIDAGNSLAAGLPAMDMLGNPRRVDDAATVDTGIGAPVVDMGAHEFPATTCACDIDGGGLAVTDIFGFLSLWFAADSRADFDGNTAVEVPDIFGFLDCWFAGCN